MTVKADKLIVFIDSVVSFFSQVGENLKEIDTPYLSGNDQPLAYDYTGVIKITGPLRGSVYVSAPTGMLRKLLDILNEPDSSLGMMKDLVGEIANTVAGNARTQFGSEFIISPPVIIQGKPSVQYLPLDQRSYVIPFHWQGATAVIGICVQ